jgi:hypothetical protein
MLSDPDLAIDMRSRKLNPIDGVRAPYHIAENAIVGGLLMSK